MAGFLNENQTQKLRIIGQIKNDLSTLRFPPPDPARANLAALSGTLYSLYGYCGAAIDEIGTNAPSLTGQLRSLRAAIERLRKDMLQGDAAEWEVHSKKLAEFQQALFNDLRERKVNLVSLRLAVEDLMKTNGNRYGRGPEPEFTGARRRAAGGRPGIVAGVAVGR